MYKIELLCANNRWERAWSFEGEYTLAEAKAILGRHGARLRPCCKGYQFRMVKLNPKPYRRHAAITPLELRGAIQMLENARHHVVESIGIGPQAGFDAFVILVHARLDCVRALESL